MKLTDEQRLSNAAQLIGKLDAAIRAAHPNILTPEESLHIANEAIDVFLTSKLVKDSYAKWYDALPSAE